MTRSADIAKAREVDTRIAAAWAEYWTVQNQIAELEKVNRETNKSISRTRHAAAKASLEARVDRNFAKIVELEPVASEKRAAAEKMDEDLYEGWSRFFLVKHIHSNQYCSSFRPTTRVGWLPNVSGLTEAEAVKEHGATLCTICFPSAPVELTTAAVDETVCPGSGTYVKRDLPNRLGYYSGNWATCPDCGERVTVAGQNGVKLRKHKK